MPSTTSDVPSILKEFSITLGLNAVLWRATYRANGTIKGLESAGNLTILLTDGVVAWFVNDEGTLFHGHISHFSGEVKPAWWTPPVTIPKEKKPKKKTKTDLAMESVENLLGL